MERAWIDTGTTHHVPNEVDRIPNFDPRSADHLWAIITMYQWGGPTVETPLLDRENLLSIVGPGCYYCGSDWSENKAKRRCPGKPA